MTRKSNDGSLGISLVLHLYVDDLAELREVVVQMGDTVHPLGYLLQLEGAVLWVLGSGTETVEVELLLLVDVVVVIEVVDEVVWVPERGVVAVRLFVVHDRDGYQFSVHVGLWWENAEWRLKNTANVSWQYDIY